MITAKIGNRIRELRTQTGLSQEKFAQKIGMDRTYYASVEAGKRNISLQNIKKIADEYKDKIPQKLYEALYNWKIEEDD